MADITVLKNDGVTNIVYVAKAPSAGDNVPAIWRSDAHPAPYSGLKPEVRFVSRYNGPKTARRCSITGVYTSYATDSTTGVSSAIGRVVMDISVTAPTMVSQADIDEAVSQLTNFLTSTLIRSSLKVGFAPG